VIYGFEANWEFYQDVRRNFSLGHEEIRYNLDSQYFGSVLSRLIEARSSLVGTRAWLVWLGYGCFAANLVFLWINRCRWKCNDEVIMAILFLSLPFLLETSWPHYFVCLPFCQTTVLINLLIQRDSTTLADSLAGWSLLTPYLYFLLYISILFSSIFFFQLMPSFASYGRNGFLLWANLFLIVCLYGIAFRSHATARASNPAPSTELSTPI